MTDFIVPVEGWITCTFECHRQRTEGRIFGVDIGVSYVPWGFSADGRVTFAGWADDAGLMVEQTFRDRWGGEGLMRYAHLSSVAVGAGAIVQQGQRGGVTGNSGNTTGPHIHWDLRYKRRADALWIMEPYWDDNPAGFNVDPILAVLKSQQQEEDEMQHYFKVRQYPKSGPQYIYDPLTDKMTRLSFTGLKILGKAVAEGKITMSDHVFTEGEILGVGLNP